MLFTNGVWKRVCSQERLMVPTRNNRFSRCSGRASCKLGSVEQPIGWLGQQHCVWKSLVGMSYVNGLFWQKRCEEQQRFYIWKTGRFLRSDLHLWYWDIVKETISKCLETCSSGGKHYWIGCSQRDDCCVDKVYRVLLYVRWRLTAISRTTYECFPQN